MADLQINIRTSEKDVLDLFGQLSKEMKYAILELYTFEDILGEAEKQLRGESVEYYAWDTLGWRHGSRLRECIIKTTGLEAEYRKDKESIIRSLERNVEHYKKYYDYYFKAYHNEEAYNVLKRTIGVI